MRSRPLPLPVSRWTASTTSTLSAARSGSGIRPPATAPRSRSRPFRVALRTSATQSTNVLAPGRLLVKVIVEVEAHTSPSSRPRRSTSMS